MGYLLRRLIYLPLSLLLLSLLCFALSRATPGDPVEQRMSAEGERGVLSQDPSAYLARYRRLAAEMHYDLPPFYLTLTNASLPDTLYRIAPRSHRQLVRRLATRYGSWPNVQNYYRAVEQLAYHRPLAAEAGITLARRLLLDRSPEQERLLEIPAYPELTAVREAYASMVSNPQPGRVLLPRLIWNGTDNQYHRYLAGMLRGDFGVSYTDRRSVAGKIARALPRTALLNGVALFLVYLLAVPLGMYMARYAGSLFDRWATLLTFLGFGIPSFWVATLLANFFTTPAFGMDYFPSMGFGDVPPGVGWWEEVQVRASHLILPVACLTYPALAYVARHLRAAALLQLRQPYVNTARMKGLSESQVLWRHVFRNAAFPLVTLLGGLLPGLLAGSVLIEQIFNLPGMGRLLFTSALARDWPVVTALVLLNGLVTVIGLWLADVGYVLLDPRLRLGKRGLQ